MDIGDIKLKIEKAIINTTIEHHKWFEKHQENSRKTFLNNIVEELKKYKSKKKLRS